MDCCHTFGFVVQCSNVLKISPSRLYKRQQLFDEFVISQRSKKERQLSKALAFFAGFSHFAPMKDPTFKFNKITVIVIQCLLWVVFYLLLLMYTSHKWDHPLYGFMNASIATSSYVVAVYGNALWLLPRILQKGRVFLYVLFSLAFLIGIILLRMTAEAKVLMPLHKTFYTWQWAHFSFNAITILTAFLFGALLRVFLNYLQLVQQKKELQAKQSEAELNLLKAQVQPHFLFNTLNNIYSLAQSHSSKTPDMIAKLSELMRYFIDEAPKQQVPLATEMNFIRNYVELEQIRMLHPVCVNWNVDEKLLDTNLPPMLLMPFVENVFKHGIDKLKVENRMEVMLREKEGSLFFKVQNSTGDVTTTRGSGLENLQKRLELLFPGRYTLRTEKQANEYIASLQIPLL